MYLTKHLLSKVISPRTIKMIPENSTLTKLYQTGQLLPAAQALKQPNPSLDDRILLWHGDITKLSTQSIVNAAKSTLLGGGGVDGSIHRAAGPDLKRACAAIQPPNPQQPDVRCPAGEARLTAGFDLPAQYVIHTVGPQFQGFGTSQPVLKSCYDNTLKLAVQNGISEVAFCGISTGVYGYPAGEAAKVACGAVRDFLDGEKGDEIKLIVFVTFVQADVAAYAENIPKFFPPAVADKDEK